MSKFIYLQTFLLRLFILLFIGLFSVCHVFAGRAPELSRESTFKSLDEFVASAKAFRPSNKPTEFAYIFSVPAYDNGSFQRTVFAQSINEVKLLWQGGTDGERHAVFALYAEPKTEDTRSYVAAIVLLNRTGGNWLIYDVKREAAYGQRGGVQCKLAHDSDQNSKQEAFKWLDGVRITIESQWAGVRYRGELKQWTYRVDYYEFTLVGYTITSDE